MSLALAGVVQTASAQLQSPEERPSPEEAVVPVATTVVAHHSGHILGNPAT